MNSKAGRQGHPSSTGTEAPALAPWLPPSLTQRKGRLLCPVGPERDLQHRSSHQTPVMGDRGPPRGRAQGHQG